MRGPSGTVAFLFTDVEGSTRLWEEAPEAMQLALERHDATLRQAIEEGGGYVFATGGDGFAAAFGTAGAAVAAAIEAQVRLSCEAPDERAPLRVRMAVHTGEVAERDGDYFGAAVNRTARLMALAHGGQVLVSRTTVEILGPDVAVLDLGEHRLRDLTLPEHVFQLCDASLPSEFPPLRSLGAYPSNLPTQTTAFVGRDDQMRDARIALDECRVVTLTGVGGVGKTRLALQVAAEVLPQYRDGVWVVELGGVSNGIAAEEAIASALGAQQQSGQALRESLLSFLRTKRLLLVLDNCEHLLDLVAALVEDMTGGAPDLTVLATSREALRVAGEQVVAVPSLTVPDEATGIDELASAPAVRLFVDRARAGRPDFTLGPENATEVAHLCRRLDGVPLAIELAAARARTMTPDEIASRLDQRFRLLTGGTRTAANRHQTLRAAIDWSYDLLADNEKALFSRLSVFAGGFDLRAAEAIGSGGAIDAIDADDILGRLVDKSLISAHSLRNATRFRMLETIREYALERLEASGEIEGVRTRHAEHFARVTAEAGTGLKGPKERTWLEGVEEDLDNLRSAVTWSLDSGEPDVALRCVLALGMQGLRFQPTTSAWAAAIVGTAVAERHPAYPAALAVLAWATTHEGRPDEAVRLARAALEALGDGPVDPEVVCRVASPVAGIAPVLGRPPGPEVTRWLDAARASGDPYEEALALTMRSVSQRMRGDTAATSSAEQALAMARISGSPTAIAYATFNLASHEAQSDPGRAVSLIDESLRCAEEAGNDYAASLARGARGYVLTAAGDHAGALASWLDAARGAAREGRRDFLAIGLLPVSAWLAALGAFEAAAVVRGWIEGVLGNQDLAINASGYLTEEVRAAILGLPLCLGERYSVLVHTGAAMGESEIIEYAAAHTPESPPSPIPDSPSSSNDS
ncbi:MAG: adenylate/guanylate cyclase domain-containing protein [Acidimicrobiales bacterium]